MKPGPSSPSQQSFRFSPRASQLWRFSLGSNAAVIKKISKGGTANAKELAAQMERTAAERKGKTLDLVTPVTVSQQGNSASFDGSLVLKRADYAIGDGMWADFGTVANEIQIKFHLVASAGAATK